MTLSEIKSSVQTHHGMLSVDLLVVKQMRSPSVQKCIEGQSIGPRGGEVLDIHASVVLRVLLAPSQQRFLQIALVQLGHSRLEVIDLKPEDDAPDKTQSQLLVSVHDALAGHAH